MVNNYSFNLCSDELYHHGILGMKWGVRRYQNADGSLTPAGKKRYDVYDAAQKNQLSLPIMLNRTWSGLEKVVMNKMPKLQRDSKRGIPIKRKHLVKQR